MDSLNVVSPTEWISARLSLLEKEEELQRAKDALAIARQKLPVEPLPNEYTFTTIDPATNAEVSVPLADLFAGKSQLIVYHFMFGPEVEAGCPHCSVLADHIPSLDHLRTRDTNLVVVSRAPAAKLDAYKKRMGWTNFQWYSANGSSFNFDFSVTSDPDVAPVRYNYKNAEELKAGGLDFHLEGEQPGLSVFVKAKDGTIYHSYSTYSRGPECLIGTCDMLDMTLLGRQDETRPSFGRRDEYSK